MLVSLAEMKTYLGISATTYDTFLTEQITLISDTAETYCRRKFNQATYTQTWYTDEIKDRTNRLLQVFHFPIVSVTTVKVDTVLVDATLYRIHKDTGTVTMLDNFPSTWDELEIVYSAGYAAIPNQLKSVCYQLVEERYNKKVSGVSLNFGSDVQRVSVPGTISIDFDYTLQTNERSSAFGSILGNTLNVIDYYRSERNFDAIKEMEYVS